MLKKLNKNKNRKTLKKKRRMFIYLFTYLSIYLKNIFLLNTQILFQKSAITIFV